MQVRIITVLELMKYPLLELSHANLDPQPSSSLPWEAVENSTKPIFPNLVFEAIRHLGKGVSVLMENEACIVRREHAGGT